MSSETRISSDDLFHWLALHFAPGVGPVRCQALIKRFKTPRAVFQAAPEELAQVPGLPGSAGQALQRFDWRGRVEAEMRAAQRLGVRLVCLDDPGYPPRLKNIPDPPPVLWVLGSFTPTDELAVALVGARAATEYGRATATRLGRELGRAGVSVVSGLAVGVDAAAHQGALAAGGRTIGVLGCGVDVLYPRPNRKLWESIPTSGAIVSELALGTPPEPGFFPRRNRIISGLGLGVVVVEAGERSGSLITARRALDQNREVFAVPGPVGSPKSRGVNDLLRQGARLVESALDILEEISPQLEKKPPAGPGSALETRMRARMAPRGQAPPGLGEPGLAIWKMLEDGPMHVDKICRALKTTPGLLAPQLLELELNGVVAQLPGMRYSRT